MSLRDRFRARRNGAPATAGEPSRPGGAEREGQGVAGGSTGRDGRAETDGRAGQDVTAAHGDSLASTGEVTTFEPRPDGDYHCAERDLYLRFARPIVTEIGAGGDRMAQGEFTSAGRFSVQHGFDRPAVYTVLTDASLSADDAVLVVRRTDTATGTAQRLEFAFEPDAY